MALVHKGFFLDLQLADAAGDKSTVSIDLDYADWAALNTAIGAGDIDDIITDLKAVTQAAVAGYRIGEAFVEDTDKYGAAGSEVENIALLSCQLDGRIDEYVNLRIPAPVSGVFQATQGKKRNIVDITYADLLTWLAHFTAAGECLVSDGESIETVSASTVNGKRIHRGSRKG